MWLDFSHHLLSKIKLTVEMMKSAAEYQMARPAKLINLDK